MMDDLVQFLRDRLAEDEQAARAATWDEWDSAHWTAHHRARYDGRWVIVDHAEEGVTELTPHAADDAGVAQHIARHDPARVLREVEAKRRLLTDYEENAADLDAQHAPDMDCVGRADGLETALQHLATAYADRPDYRDAWRP
ncbi:DUF6221 family protein [Streptomyces sp. sk226]|uniref:DUF6221 family protein n=1 Tax=Streptomyces sp. sk226 TaxID=2034268 RepID=UPI000BF091ED|nr:DUF6221 family protein [Streptomyces sp. sk226]